MQCTEPSCVPINKFMSLFIDKFIAGVLHSTLELCLNR